MWWAFSQPRAAQWLATAAAAADRLTVYPASTLYSAVLANAAVTVAGTLTDKGTAQVDINSSPTLVVNATNATTTFSAPVTANAVVNATSNVIVGTNINNSLTVSSGSTLYGAITSVTGSQVRAVVITSSSVSSAIPSMSVLWTLLRALPPAMSSGCRSHSWDCKFRCKQVLRSSLWRRTKLLSHWPSLQQLPQVRY